MSTKEINQRILDAVPKEIIVLIYRFNHLGYEIFIVGGFIRNIIMNKPIKDLDLSTNLKPRQVIDLGRDWGVRVLPTGLRYGTVTIMLKNQYEITTYRMESEYDGRRPKTVSFIDNWIQDSNRRDFTFNALFWHPKQGLMDAHNGLNDACVRRIRFVGKYDERIREDRIRLWRYLRFNFLYSLQNWSWARIHFRTWGGKNLSRERIYKEVIQIFNLREWDTNHYVILRKIPDELSIKWFGTTINKYLLRKQSNLENMIRMMGTKDRILIRIVLTFGLTFLYKFLNKIGNSLNWIRKEIKALHENSILIHCLEEYWRMAFICNGRMNVLLIIILFNLCNSNKDTLPIICLRLHSILVSRYNRLTYPLKEYSNEDILKLRREVSRGRKIIYPRFD